MAGFQVVLDGMKPFAAKLQEKSQEDFLNCCKRATLLLRNNARKKTPVAKSAVYQDAARSGSTKAAVCGVPCGSPCRLNRQTVKWDTPYTTHPTWSTDTGRRSGGMCRRSAGG